MRKTWFCICIHKTDEFVEWSNSWQNFVWEIEWVSVNCPKICLNAWQDMRELSFAVGSLALLLVFPGPVGLLTVLTTVSSVPATPVDGLSLALVTLKLIQNVIKTNKSWRPRGCDFSRPCRPWTSLLRLIKSCLIYTMKTMKVM